MTDFASFIAAIKSDPDNDVPRLAFADFIEEQDAPSERDRATAAFIRLACRQAKPGAPITAAAGSWLAFLGGISECVPHGRGVRGSSWSTPGWEKLVPCFVAWADENGGTVNNIRAVRKGRRIEIVNHSAPNDRVEFHFMRGFLARVVFRSWQFADVVLPLLLDDQPLMEPELTNSLDKHHEANPRLDFCEIRRERVGPAFDLLKEWNFEDRGSAMVRGFRRNKLVADYTDGDVDRARTALSAALLARARLINLGKVKAGAGMDEPSEEALEHA